MQKNEQTIMVIASETHYNSEPATKEKCCSCKREVWLSQSTVDAAKELIPDVQSIINTSEIENKIRTLISIYCVRCGSGELLKNPQAMLRPYTAKQRKVITEYLKQLKKVREN